MQFYYFSTECFSPELPVLCGATKSIKSREGREVVLVECDRKIKSYKTKFLLLVPRNQNESISDISKYDQIFVYVLDGKNFVDKVDIDLSKMKNCILDIGGISNSYEKALVWQVKESD